MSSRLAISAATTEPDAELADSEGWLSALSATGAERDAAVRRRAWQEREVVLAGGLAAHGRCEQNGPKPGRDW